MSTKGQSGRGHARRWSMMTAVGMVLVGISAGSCLVPNQQHCALGYGDRSCEQGRCILADEKRSHERIENGCAEDAADELAQGFVAVPYGLPVRVEGSEERSDPRSVQGVLVELDLGPWEACAELGRLEEHFGEVIGGVAEVRRHLEQRGKTRVSAFDLEQEHIEALARYEAAFGEWLAGCAGQGTDTETTGTSTGETETEGEGETNGTGSTTTGEPECMVHADCIEPARPLCGPEKECVPCIDPAVDGAAGCAEKDPEQPLVCVTDGLWAGHCRECTAQATDACAGVCDTENNVCLPCTAHDQCGEAACNLFTGACLPEDAVVHVGPGQDFVTIGEAVASVAEGAEGTIIVHPPMTNYDESVTVDGGRVIAFLAVEIGGGTEVPRWVRSAGDSPQLTVGDATVLMDGMQVSGNISLATTGLLLDGGRAWLDRSRIINNDGGGILAQQDVDGNTAELVLRNCFVGGDVNDVAALEVNGSIASVLYTTLGGGFGTATALNCDARATVDVRNALLVARTTTDEIMCDAMVEFSATELGLGGVGLGDMNISWFVSYGAGDFHLTISAPAAIDTAAEWRTGDPPTDIDGDPRPSTDLTLDFAGADVP